MNRFTPRSTIPIFFEVRERGGQLLNALPIEAARRHLQAIAGIVQEAQERRDLEVQARRTLLSPRDLVEGQIAGRRRRPAIADLPAVRIAGLGRPSPLPIGESQ